MKQYKSLFSKLFTLAGMVCFMIAFFSCKKNEESNLYLHNKQDATQTAFADEDKTAGFTFTAKNSWVVFVYENTTSKSNDVSWIQLFCNEKVAIDGRAGTFTIDVALETNYTGQTRMATIEIVSGSDKIIVTVTQSGKNKDGEVPEQEPVVIDLTDAISEDNEIATLKIFSIRCESGECVDYLLVSTEVAQTGYKITLPNPETVQIPLSNWRNTSFNISDTNAMSGAAFGGPFPYNSKGKQLGEFELRSGKDWIAIYIYFDRDCDVTGIGGGTLPTYASCYFKKGWNIYYLKGEYREGIWINIMTTEKPVGENFKWGLWLWCKNKTNRQTLNSINQIIRI